MEELKKRTRRIRFNSDKNNGIVEVNSDAAFHMSKTLEVDEEVVQYLTNVPLDMAKYKFMEAVGIKKTYFAKQWVTSFKIYRRNGSVSIRELIPQHHLNRPSSIQKLELSRRYWEQEKITDWKIILF